MPTSMPAAGNDGLEVDIEAVREHQQLARRQVRLNIRGINLGLNLVGREDHDHIGPLRRFRRRNHFEACLFCLGNGLGFRGGQTDFDLHAGVLEVEGMSVPLRAVADNGDLFGLNQG
jgi:hypothetical protein